MTMPDDGPHSDDASPTPPADAAAERPSEMDEAEDAVRIAEKEAEEAVREAEEQLDRARQLYRRVRGRATERLKRMRQTSGGDLVDVTLKLVKQYPGPSMLVALLVGFFLGRSFRR